MSFLALGLSIAVSINYPAITRTVLGTYYTFLSLLKPFITFMDDLDPFKLPRVFLNLGPSWTSWRPFWTFLDLLEPSWTFFSFLEPSWTLLNLIKPSWTFLNLLEPSLSFLTLLDPSWILLSLTAPFRPFIAHKSNYDPERTNGRTNGRNFALLELLLS